MQCCKATMEADVLGDVQRTDNGKPLETTVLLYILPSLTLEETGLVLETMKYFILGSHTHTQSKIFLCLYLYTY